MWARRGMEMLWRRRSNDNEGKNCIPGGGWEHCMEFADLDDIIRGIRDNEPRL